MRELEIARRGLLVNPQFSGAPITTTKDEAERELDQDFEESDGPDPTPSALRRSPSIGRPNRGVALDKSVVRNLAATIH